MRYGMPRKILVPTDFTDVSKAALKEAAAVAQDCSAELIVLFANDRQEKDMVGLYLKQKIDEVVPRSVPVDVVVVADSPVDAILTVAREKNADWIVMGAHDRTSDFRALHGSITEEVLRRAGRPVMAVHA